MASLFSALSVPNNLLQEIKYDQENKHATNFQDDCLDAQRQKQI